MATRAFETDNNNCVAGGRVGVLPMHPLAAAPTEMGYGACGMARAGCTASCPRFAQCGSMDRQAPASVVSLRIRV
jgi:hypothetical protein